MGSTPTPGTVIVLRALLFLVATAAIFAGIVVAFAVLTVVTGGGLLECDRGECGLGEALWFAFPLVPVLFLLAAGAAAWALTRRVGRR